MLAVSVVRLSFVFDAINSRFPLFFFFFLLSQETGVSMLLFFSKTNKQTNILICFVYFVCLFWFLCDLSFPLFWWFSGSYCILGHFAPVFPISVSVCFQFLYFVSFLGLDIKLIAMNLLCSTALADSHSFGMLYLCFHKLFYLILNFFSHPLFIK